MMTEIWSFAEEVFWLKYTVNWEKFLWQRDGWELIQANKNMGDGGGRGGGGL